MTNNGQPTVKLENRKFDDQQRRNVDWDESLLPQVVKRIRSVFDFVFPKEQQAWLLYEFL
jgi:hypothetical protein